MLHARIARSHMILNAMGKDGCLVGKQLESMLNLSRP